jgi:predicted DNA-binding transcriptional regulator YafY
LGVEEVGTSGGRTVHSARDLPRSILSKLEADDLLAGVAQSQTFGDRAVAVNATVE